MSGTKVLTARGVHAGYGKARVLNGVSLSVQSGQQVTILGPNGSGKSTMAKTLMGLTSMYDGEITWEDREISTWTTSRRARSGLGYVPQLDNTFPSLSVEENLSVGDQRLRGRARTARLEQQYVLFPRLKERRRVVAGHLSGGERRMLALASALMRKPELLILDEPTSDLAPAIIDAMFDTIALIRDTVGVPLIIVEQNVQRALEVADYVYILIRGQVVLERAADSVTVAEIGDVFMEHLHEDQQASLPFVTGESEP